MSLFCKSFASVLCVCMELMHDFVKGCVYCISGKYTYLEASAYLICDARTKGWLSITSLINRGSHKVGIRAILTVETLSLVVFRMF